MTVFWQMPYGQDPEDPEALDVTGFGDPVRSFISLRDPLPEELAEFRAAFLREAGDPARTIILPEETPLLSSGTHRGQCQGCGLDDDVSIWGKCAYCAELAALRTRNLPGPRLSGWWFTIPAALAFALLAALFYAVLAVVLAW